MVEDLRESNPDIDYERRDLSLRPLLILAIALIVLLGVGPFIVLLGFPSTRHDVDRRLTALPPAPRLQTQGREDLEAYFAREQKLLDSYGWVDRAGGIVHVPIAVAMQRLVREGIPGFPGVTPPPKSREGAPP